MAHKLSALLTYNLHNMHPDNNFTLDYRILGSHYIWSLFLPSFLYLRGSITCATTTPDVNTRLRLQQKTCDQPQSSRSIQSCHNKNNHLHESFKLSQGNNTITNFYVASCGFQFFLMVCICMSYGQGMNVSNCHFKGHRVTECHQPPCQRYFE